MASLKSWCKEIDKLGLDYTFYVQPHMPTLAAGETRMYYSMDQQNKLIPLAEMHLSTELKVKPYQKSPNEIYEYRVRDQVKKVFKEKINSRNFKQDVGHAITHRHAGIFNQPFLCYRINCYAARLRGGQTLTHMVNSMGFFPLVPIDVDDAKHEIARMVIAQHCEWVEKIILAYPMA